MRDSYTMHKAEEPTDGERADTKSRRSLRGLLARIARNTEPETRKRPDDSGRREVRGD